MCLLIFFIYDIHSLHEESLSLTYSIKLYKCKMSQNEQRPHQEFEEITYH